MTKKDKIQSLLITHLLKYGQISLKLPDGVVLEIGLTQENDRGELEIDGEYCWVIASQGDRTASLDSYNLGISFLDNEKSIVFDESDANDDGEMVRRVNVV
jgi:hypothetical protein